MPEIEDAIDVSSLAVETPFFTEVPRITVLKTVASGEIRLDLGADGVYLQFDCDCLDALPFCKAQCCSMPGTTVYPDEVKEIDLPIDWDEFSGEPAVMRRDADGFCSCLDRTTRTCGVYDDRPRTCQEFHCTRGPHVRGWKLPNTIRRFSGA